jgi:tyrosyl-DNA phosphodiesterase-1
MMNDQSDGDEPPRKRAKVKESFDTQTNISSPLTSLATPITPPQRKALIANEGLKFLSSLPQIPTAVSAPKVVSSPFQLTSIRDLPAALNADALTLKDLLSDPLISECWEFNYLLDVDMLMEAFDPDVRDLVKVHVVHGFWKHEDGVGLKVSCLYFLRYHELLSKLVQKATWTALC